MSKICTVCGYQCEDSVILCPVCGSPFSTAPQSVATPVSATPQQIVASTPSQDAIPSQAVPPIPPQPGVPVPGTGPIPQQFVQPNVYIPYPQGPAMQGQGIQGIPEPPKKKNKTLWIVLGIVGGLLLLLIILAIILVFALKNVWNNRANPSPQTPDSISHSNHHEYYYEDYDNASFQSEAFVDITTEDPSSIPSTEEPENPSSSGAIEDLRSEDLMLYTIEAEGVEPYAYTLEENYCYIINSSSGVIQTGGFTEPFLTSDAMWEPDELKNKQCQLGRGIQAGSSIDECIAAYGIDTTNAIWRLSEDNTFSYYYYSTTVRPDSITNPALIIGWYKNGDTWQRMYHMDLSNYWQKSTLPECDALLMYILDMDDSGETISSISILYGNNNSFQDFTSETQVQGSFNEAE